MKNLIYVFVAALMISSCQEQQKIGYVDNGEVINKFQEKIDLEEKFKVKQEAFTKKFDSLDLAFQAEVQKFQAAAQRMSQTKAQERYQELGQQKQILDQQKQYEAQQFQQEFQVEIDSIVVTVKDFVKDYGKKNGYTYILGTSDSDPAANVLYGTDENNLTQTIIDALNAEGEKEEKE